MINFFSTIKSEILNFINDKGAVLIMVIGIIAYSLFYAMPYSTEVVKDIPIGVIDYDNSNLSRNFIKNLDVTDSVKVFVQSISKEEIEKSYYSNNIKGFIIIPKNFEKNILRGKSTKVELFADSGYIIIYKSIYSATIQTAMNMGAKIEIGKLMKSGVPKQTALSLKQPFKFVQIPLYNFANGYETYVYPSILVMILHQTLVVGLGLMQGTRTELKEPYCQKEKDIYYVLFIRCTLYVLLYLFYSIIIFLIYPALFNYPMAYNIIPLFLLLIPLFYGACFFAHTVSYFFKTRESALLIMISTALIFIFLPGFIWPKESIPVFINILSMFIPATCGIDGIIKLNQMYGTFWDVKFNFLWLIFLCIVYFISAKLAIQKNNSITDETIK